MIPFLNYFYLFTTLVIMSVYFSNLRSFLRLCETFSQSVTLSPCKKNGILPEGRCHYQNFSRDVSALNALNP